MRRFINLLLLQLYMVAGIMAQSHVNDIDTPGNCLKYSVHGNQVEFHCENDILVSLKICNQSVIRLWYDKGTFSRNNQSFAVETDDLTDVDTVVVSELPQSYEIFTSDLIIRVNKNPFRIRFYDKYQKLLLDDFSDRGYVKDSTGQWAFKTLRNDEHFFGLGEKSGSLDRRGKVFRMWNSDKPCYGVNEDPLYKSIPFFMSNYGYGIFFDNTSKSEFDFGAQSDKYFSFGSPGGEMTWYFIFGPTYKQIMKQYTGLTGKPILPPAWALGFSQCRGLLTNEELTRSIASGFRERQIPCDIIYQDIGWTQHLQDFNWRKENYKDPQKMLSDLSELGFKVIVSQDPVISQNNLHQWREADSLGFFTKDIRTGKSYDMPWPWGGNCGVVDFTNPAVANWWGNYQQKVINDGVRGFWTDMGEPAWSNEENTDRLFMKHHLGMHAEIHNVYGLTWDKVVTGQFEQHNPNKRVFQMTRAAFAGMQRYTFGWSGDSGDGSDVLNGWEKLAGQIPLSLSAGMGLIPFWTTDISGYCGDIKDHEAMAELYIRWMQFGVFNPLSRAHHEGNNAAEPWAFGPEAEQICRDAINLKYRLHPYIYTYARDAWDTGLPLMRALLLEYPADAEVLKADGEFLFGKELLVAPVVEKESSSKQIYLPQGEWIDFNNGKTVYQGRQWIAYDTPLNVIPLFVRKGSVLPTMPLMQYIGEKKNYPVIFEVFPASAGRSATFELYEDDGESNDYKRDICRITNVKCTTGTLLFNISIEHVDQNGFNQIQVRNNGLRVHLEVCPASVMLNGEKIKKINPRQVEENWFEISSKACWYWDELNGTCVVKFTENKLKDEITINK